MAKDGESKGDLGKDKKDPTARDYVDGGDREGDESKTHEGEDYEGSHPIGEFFRDLYDQFPDVVRRVGRKHAKGIKDLFGQLQEAVPDFVDFTEVEDTTSFADPGGLDVVTIDIMEPGALKRKTHDVSKRLMDEHHGKKEDKDRGGKSGDKSKTHKGDEDYTAKKEEDGDDKRKDAEKDGGQGTLAETPGHGRVDY